MHELPGAQEPASVAARLRDNSRRTGDDYQLLLVAYFCVVLGQRNSRIKDFFDVHYLCGHRGFEGPTLAEAIRRTFAKRGTPLPEGEPVGLTTVYWEDPARVVQVRAFVRRAGILMNPDNASEILPLLRTFLLPILEEVRRGTQELDAWPPGGPWR